MTPPAELDAVLARPDLPAIAELITRRLAEEKTLRHQFRDWLTPEVKAEFINGQTVMHSPAKAGHLRVTQRLMGLLRPYVDRHGLGEVFTDKALICLSRNDYEPDVCFFGLEKAADLGDETVRFPVPDFVAEVLSESTEKRDRGIKFDDYAAHGIAEYWIIDGDRAVVEQYGLAPGASSYHRTRKFSSDEVIQSERVAGFRIAVAALFDEVAHRHALGDIFAH